MQGQELDFGDLCASLLTQDILLYSTLFYFYTLHEGGGNEQVDANA